ncbi:hypothetical protein [Halorubrum tropicale]|uniref:Uncharacterized protein n=1 Tax=Halorubrum tropicale TaxID=1765655 RepID=A0A0M9AL38_9EURY|nr:hypothetical protein [Halorubrum tropicale]KOX94239.1 hypothetical protein AMR74_16170 [Halorubrum tropicale]
MTRPSKREIERAIEDLDAESIDDDGFSVVFEDTETGEWYEEPDLDGEPLDQDTVDPTIVWRDDVVETGWEPTEDSEADPR